MNVTITPTQLHGFVTPPPSKSQAHRLLLAAALAHGASTLSNVAFSQDIQATVRCLEALGADVRREGDCLSVTGLGGPRPPDGAAPGALFRHLPGEGRLLRAEGRYAHGQRSARPRGIHPAGECVLPVYHRPALRPASAARRLGDPPHHPAGEPGLCGYDHGRPERVRRGGEV